MSELKDIHSLPFKNTRVDCAKVVEVIMITSCVGKGTADDPCREEIAYWTTGGSLIGIINPNGSKIN